MKIDEITTPRAYNRSGKPLLRTTQVHYQQARGNKNQLIILINPMDFLKLTSPPGEIETFMRNTQGLLAYNRYAKSGENIIMPFLRILVNGIYGKVTAHEGRHRAAAVIKAGGDWMRVAVELKANRDYEPQMYKDAIAKYGYPKSNLEYYMTEKDLPKKILGQYDSQVIIDSSNLRIEQGDFLSKYRKD
jgi:hypothetical protein